MLGVDPQADGHIHALVELGEMGLFQKGHGLLHGQLGLGLKVGLDAVPGLEIILASFTH
jgi:hypothetical protein